MNIAPYGGAVRAPRKSAHPNHLFELTALTYKPQMLRDTKQNINLPATLLPTDAQLPTEPLARGAEATRCGPETERG